jgi:hypothetical protein
MQRDGISIQNILVGKSENNEPFARCKRRWEDNIKSEVELSAFSVSDPVEGSCEHGIKFSAFVNGEFF